MKYFAKYNEIRVVNESLGTFIYIHFTVSSLKARKTDAAVRVDAILTGATMEARVLVTLIDLRLTENTFEALAAFTPEAGNQVVTSSVLIRGESFN